MKKLILKPYDRIIIAILGCIGFLTGCSLINPPLAEYGTPTADYEIKGTVTDSITSGPIPKARVTITRSQTYTTNDSTAIHIDTLAIKETDVAGKYDITMQQFPLEDITFEVKIEDVDGSANGGNFNPRKKDVSFKFSDLSKGNNSWYLGKAEKTQNFKLKKK